MKIYKIKKKRGGVLRVGISTWENPSDSPENSFSYFSYILSINKRILNKATLNIMTMVNNVGQPSIIKVNTWYVIHLSIITSYSLFSFLPVGIQMKSTWNIRLYKQNMSLKQCVWLGNGLNAYTGPNNYRNGAIWLFLTITPFWMCTSPMNG